MANIYVDDLTRATQRQAVNDWRLQHYVTLRRVTGVSEDRAASAYLPVEMA
jgi:hypothetical protein